MKLIMTGLDHKRATLELREQFTLTKEKTGRLLTSIKAQGLAAGCVIISTCNRTELYASIPEGAVFEPSKTLCNMLGKNFSEYKHFFMERLDEQAIDHLCRVASGIDSQILGDDQIITQVREALELARGQSCTDSYMETMFRLAIKAAKVIKTQVILKSLGADSVPSKAVEKLKSMLTLTKRNVLVIGNGQVGRRVAELLIREYANVTVTLREYKKGVIQVPKRASTISYSERYQAIERADIVVSATTSPHFTITKHELSKLARFPEVIVDLALPKDVESELQNSVTLLTLDDVSGGVRRIPPESVARIDRIVEEHIKQYYRWQAFKKNMVQVGHY